MKRVIPNVYSFTLLCAKMHLPLDCQPANKAWNLSASFNAVAWAWNVIFNSLLKCRKKKKQQNSKLNCQLSWKYWNNHDWHKINQIFGQVWCYISTERQYWLWSLKNQHFSSGSQFSVSVSITAFTIAVLMFIQVLQISVSITYNISSSRYVGLTFKKKESDILENHKMLHNSK